MGWGIGVGVGVGVLELGLGLELGGVVSLADLRARRMRGVLGFMLGGFWRCRDVEVCLCCRCR